MELYSKEIADKLYKQGKMPEWFYRQHYKTPLENYEEQTSQFKESVLRDQIEHQTTDFVQRVIEDLLKGFEQYSK